MVFMENVKNSVDLEPSHDCTQCPRLVAFREQNRAAYPAFHNGPVRSFGPLDASVLIVGLAPGLKGANCTGRPFTGDFAGDLLYPTLIKYGLAKGVYGTQEVSRAMADYNDDLRLTDCRITNAVRCVPPENKATGNEVKNCGVFLKNEIHAMKNLKIILALGLLAHGAVLSALGKKKSTFKFGHQAQHDLGDYVLINSYHCSRYNTNTRRLTVEMFDQVIGDIAGLAKQQSVA